MKRFFFIITNIVISFMFSVIFVCNVAESSPASKAMS